MVQDELDILMVEDVPADAGAIESQLREDALCFRSRRVETSEAFLQALHDGLPDLVLSDFTLPEFDALAALRLLKGVTDDVPFILVTGARSEEVAMECIRAGADDYILKASLKRLGASVRNAMLKMAARREKRQAEEALRRSEEQFRLMAENSSDLIYLADADGRLVYANNSLETVLGFAPDKLVNQPVSTLVRPADESVFAKALADSRQSKQGRVAEFQVGHADGSSRILEASFNWIFDAEALPRRVVMVARDVTQRKETEKALRKLPQLIREAQEMERRRVARDLHDGVIQILSSVRFRFQSVEEKLAARSDDMQLEVARATGLLEKAISEIRSISHNLLPSELYDLGLTAAVRKLAAEFQERTCWNMELELPEADGPWSDTIKLHLYRVIQEAFTNTDRHAQARHVHLSLNHDDTRLELRIWDDGVGCPSAETSIVPGDAWPQGMGLVDMRERASALGGTFEVESRPGHGTKLALTIPLPCS